jgi:hypothetical protein
MEDSQFKRAGGCLPGRLGATNDTATVAGHRIAQDKVTPASCCLGMECYVLCGCDAKVEGVLEYRKPCEQA